MWHVLEVQLNDTQKAQELKPDGSYEKVDRHKKDLYNAQEEFCKEYTTLASKAHKLEKQARVFQPEYKN